LKTLQIAKIKPSKGISETTSYSLPDSRNGKRELFLFNSNVGRNNKPRLNNLTRTIEHTPRGIQQEFPGHVGARNKSSGLPSPTKVALNYRSRQQLTRQADIGCRGKACRDRLEIRQYSTRR
jgi:hypothetical protein